MRIKEDNALINFEPFGDPPGVSALRCGVLVWLNDCCLFGDSVLSSDLDLGFLGVDNISCSFCVAKLFFGDTESSCTFLSGSAGGISSCKGVTNCANL